MRTSPWLVATYVVIIALGILTALPNVLPSSVLDRMPSWLPKEHVSLGLDLRGGSHLVLEVDRADLVQERLQGLVQEARGALRAEGIATTSIRRQGDVVLVTLADTATLDRAVSLLGALSTPVGVAGVAAGTGDLTITPRADRTIAIGLSEAGIRDRVNAAVEQSLELSLIHI